MSHKYCGGCGSKLPENANFCGECGTAVDQKEKLHHAASRQKDSSEPEPAVPGTHHPTETSHYGFNVQVLVFWALIWGFIWASLYPIRSYPYFDSINFIRLLSYLLAGLISGTVAGGLLQRLTLTFHAPAFSLMKKPLIIWAACWGCLLAVKAVVLAFYIFPIGLFYQVFEIVTLLSPCLFGAYLVWKIFPQLSDSSQSSFDDKRTKAAIYWGTMGMLAIFIQRVTISMFFIY